MRSGCWCVRKLEFEKGIGELADVRGRRVKFRVMADEAVAATFFAIVIGARLPVELLRQLGGGGTVLTQEVVNTACWNRELGGLGLVEQGVPTSDGLRPAQTP